MTEKEPSNYNGFIGKCLSDLSQIYELTIKVYYLYYHVAGGNLTDWYLTGKFRLCMGFSIHAFIYNFCPVVWDVIPFKKMTKISVSLLCV